MFYFLKTKQKKVKLSVCFLYLSYLCSHHDFITLFLKVFFLLQQLLFMTYSFDCEIYFKNTFLHKLNKTKHNKKKKKEKESKEL